MKIASVSIVVCHMSVVTDLGPTFLDSVSQLNLVIGIVVSSSHAVAEECEKSLKYCGAARVCMSTKL